MTKIFLLAGMLAVSIAASPAGASDRHQVPEPPASINKYPIVYQITGLRDDGAAGNSGIATTINCTNPTPFLANLQIIIYNFDGSLATNKTFSLTRLQTFTASTHDTIIYAEDADLASGALLQGYAQLRSDNPQLLCGAEVVDASPKKTFAVTLTARSSNSGG